ncbi:MAG: hypothetical protein Q8M94_14965 [Ignavibacteria bacterium]|nr:hypothetical protein [Ignavibacteria bacterium]
MDRSEWIRQIKIKSNLHELYCKKENIERAIKSLQKKLAVALELEVSEDRLKEEK